MVVATGVTGLRGEAVLWNLKTGQRVRTFGEGHRDTLYGAVFSPKGDVLATAGYDRLIQLWNVKTGKRLRTLEGHNGAVHGIAFSPDGSVLASAGGDSAVKLWNTKTGQRLDTLGQPTGEQFIVAFTPDSQFVVAAGADKQIRLWRWVSKSKPRINPLVRVRFAHEDEITDLVISPDGQRLATASADRTVKLWSLPNLEPLQTFRQPTRRGLRTRLRARQQIAVRGSNGWLGRAASTQSRRCSIRRAPSAAVHGHCGFGCYGTHRARAQQRAQDGDGHLGFPPKFPA